VVLPKSKALCLQMFKLTLCSFRTLLIMFLQNSYWYRHIIIVSYSIL